MKKIIIVLSLILVSLNTYAQEKLKGMIMASVNGKTIGVKKVAISWLNGHVLEYTDDKGWFNIHYHGTSSSKLIIRKDGFKTDTLTISSNKEFHHIITKDITVPTIIVKSNKNTGPSLKKKTNIEIIGGTELAKAACCNLAECFENSATVDVTYKDPVTGTSQIQMLGLSSPYVLISQGNIPNIRGAAQAYGLTYTPGTWLKSIKVLKGAGSVSNGFESISGQINSNLKRPRTDNKLFVNLYASAVGRMESNIQITQKVSDKWFTGLYIHGNKNDVIHDRNDDGFVDNPISEQVNLMNIWEYRNNKTGWRSIITLRYLNDQKNSGQLLKKDVNYGLDTQTNLRFISNIHTKRYESQFKMGKVFKDFPYRSIGFQAALSSHDQKSFYGLNSFNINHQSAYFNALYQSVIKYTNHKFKTGINGVYDKFDEKVNTLNFARQERSIGTFFEYTYNDFEKISIISGLRADYHNLIGFFVTPRLHIKYNPNKNSVIRASIGAGRRTNSIFSENQKMFASSRVISILDSTGKIYGLNPEKALNYGLGYQYKFTINKRTGNFTLDAYRTDFTDKVVVDYEQTGKVDIYNLKGQSFANSMQVGLNYELLKGLDVKVAYKYTDTKTDYNKGLLEQPFIARDRYFANASYKTKKTKKGGFWLLNITANVIGKQRLPYTGNNTDINKRPDYSPQYTMLNGQVTKAFTNNIELYIGAENIGNYRQDNPIISADKPFDPNFDASIIYAPVMGIRPYIGLNYRL